MSNTHKPEKNDSSNKKFMLAIDKIRPGMNESRNGSRTNTKYVKSHFEQIQSKEKNPF
jgi:hypothetical protein